MNQATAERLASRMIAYLETGQAAADLFTEDVFCDFTPPLWRIQASGLEGVLAIRRHGHPGPGKVPRWKVNATTDGFVMEVEERWIDAQGDWYCREVLLATVRGESISRLAVYCTGDWDRARQEAHMAQVTLLEP